MMTFNNFTITIHNNKKKHFLCSQNALKGFATSASLDSSFFALKSAVQMVWADQFYAEINYLNTVPLIEWRLKCL